MNHFALKSKKVVIDNQMIAACVEIKGELIEAVHPYQQPLDCVIEDLGELVLMPGLVDSHVHINEPGRTEWEGFNTATQAAAIGGITTLVDMPLNCIPVTTSQAALKRKLEAVNDKLWVDCGFWGGVIDDNIDQLEELLNAGVLGVKSFLIDSGIVEFSHVNADHIRRAMPILAKHQVPYLIHAELDCADNKNPPKTMSIGNSYQSFLKSRPKQWENDAVNLMLELAREAKIQGHLCQVHIVHLSSDQALKSVEQAKKEGLLFSAETCPHYLTVCSENIADGKTLFKCCPPIRDNNNRLNLWRAIKNGVIDFIVSDHSPCTPQLKAIDSGDIEKAWGGISALQFGLPLIWTEAKKQGFSLPEISRLMSQRTAKFAGLQTIKGEIKKGLHADFLVFDENKSYFIERQMIRHRHKISPYVGRKITGKIKQTLVRGKKVMVNDFFINKPFGKALLKGQF